MFSSSFSRATALPLAVCGLAAFLPADHACGPDFPNAYLASSPDELAGLPTLSFPAELARLLPPGTTPPKFRPSPANGAINSAEADEVREALARRVSRRKLDILVADYSRNNPSEELPQEFQLYAVGAQAWHVDRFNEAIGAWRELLALPAGQRHYRTVWAHYMIGRALWDSDNQAARTSFQAAREGHRAGFADSQDLATASLGWEARILLRQKNYPEAMRLYFQQYTAGDPGAVTSLQLMLQQFFQEDGEGRITPEDILRTIATDRQLRGIVSAWFVSRGGPHAPWTLRAAKQFRSWLTALPKSKELDPAEADRWAWAAYQNGMWSEADEFARVAPVDAPASEWVRAMLLLRNGDLRAATEHLAGAARGFPTDDALHSKLFLDDDARYAATHEDLPAERLNGVRGVLALQREQYRDALRLFFEAGHWVDAAYVSEHVLTLEELQEFVNAEAPTVKAPSTGEPDRDSPEARAATRVRALRHLLARRLVRAGQFDRAREFFPTEIVPTYDRYVALVRDGYREENPRQLRALALWQAAQIVRTSGMEIQGTELEPDYAVWDGNSEWPELGQLRLTDGARQSRWTLYERRNWTGLSRTLVATEEEATRTGNVKLPTRRFHYRQRAAELAFLAATLLPDNDDLTATILNTAGRWIAPRYPDDAQLFFKTLVFRCPHTALGKAAAERHWFVPPSVIEANSISPDSKI